MCICLSMYMYMYMYVYMYMYMYMCVCICICVCVYVHVYVYVYVRVCMCRCVWDVLVYVTCTRSCMYIMHVLSCVDCACMSVRMRTLACVCVNVCMRCMNVDIHSQLTWTNRRWNLDGTNQQQALLSWRVPPGSSKWPSRAPDHALMPNRMNESVLPRCLANLSL